MAEAAAATVVGVEEFGNVSNCYDSPRGSSNAFDLADENEIIKKGLVYISSKNGLGWYVWRKRWAVLSRLALIFIKRDPGLKQSGQVNIISGGALIKNSGRVTVREDKKLLTISFPDVKRPFTFKTESFEDLHGWRIALEYAIIQALSPAPVKMESFCPLLHALKETDGRPSLLEKALCFLEEFGAKVEGILRISADVEEVQHRMKQFEQGNTELDAREDAHVVGDCVKQILRELPSSPVPVCCCNELLKAYEMSPIEVQVNAFRVAIWKKLPEPNRLLFQRILKMMYTISCTPENLMTPSAVAACMAPLLLRPILDGESDIIVETAFIDDESSQLLVVANAAKTAQAIIAFILQEYHNIFSDGNSNRYSLSVDSENCYDNEDSTDAEILQIINTGNIDAESIPGWCKDDQYEISSSEEPERTSRGSDLFDNMDGASNLSLSGHYDLPSSEYQGMAGNHTKSGGSPNRKLQDRFERRLKMFSSTGPLSDRKSDHTISRFLSSLKPSLLSPDTCADKSPEESRNSPDNGKFSSKNSTRKKSSAESINIHAIEKRQLEKKKIVLQQKLEDEVKVNESLQGSLERRKQALIERYMMLNAHVMKLQEQLQTENRVSSMTRAEAEEFVERLNLTDSELRHPPSLLQHLCGSPDSPDHGQHVQTAKNCQKSPLEDIDRSFIRGQETVATELSSQSSRSPGDTTKSPFGKSKNTKSSRKKKSSLSLEEQYSSMTMSIVASSTICSSGFDKL